MMIIERFITELNETNMYIIREEGGNSAVLIDPSDIDTIRDYTERENIHIEYVMLTHEHYDHISALNEVRQMFPECRLVASGKCSEMIQNPKKNMSKFFNIILEFKNGLGSGKKNLYKEVLPYEAEPADIVFEESDVFVWNGHRFELTEVPGHSPGSVFIKLDDSYLFSGDTVSYDYEIITKFPTGSTKDYENITKPVIDALDKNLMVYPGHGRVFKLNEFYSKNQML